MTEEFHAQIYRELDLRETNDLLEIWKTNDRVEWSDVAFDVIRDILLKRTGEVPPQSAPILEHQKVSEEQDDLEDWQEALLDDNNQPQLYDTVDVIDLNDKINKTVVAVIVVDIVLGLLNLQFVRSIFAGVLPSAAGIGQALPNIVGVAITVGLQILLTYVPLKVLGQILRILAQMEFNSRKPAPAPVTES